MSSKQGWRLGAAWIMAGLLPLGAAGAAPEVVPGQVLVRFKPGVSDAVRAGVHAREGGRSVRQLRHVGVEQVVLPAGRSVDAALQRYRADPAVLHAEPNVRVHAQLTPNEVAFAQQWALNNTGQTGGVPGADIKALQAWNLSTGSAGAVVVVIDSGIDYTHPDLAPNMFSNPMEAFGQPGVDDDGNGYIDDVHGIDVVNGSSDPMDDFGHGTLMAGIIGAAGNNAYGVVGVNWTVRLVGCKFMDATGVGSLDGALACLDYARALRASGVNVVATANAWGGTGFQSQLLRDAIAAQGDILFIAAAGNNAGDNDATAFYPASYDLPNVISVTATNAADTVPAWANLGRRSVHLGAPGEAILGTAPFGSFTTMSGSSASAAHVAGVAALLKAQNPARDGRTIRNLIIAGGAANPALAGRTVSGRRLDAFGAMSCANRPLLSALTLPSFTAGVPTPVSALSINCGAAAGPVTLTPSVGPAVTLADNGVAPDLAAGDGVFSGTWTPAAGVTFVDITSPAGTERIGLPDLRIPSFTGPASGVAGQAITLTATVSNGGAAAAPASTMNVYLSTDTVIGGTDLLVASVAVPALAAGAQQAIAVPFTVPASLAPALYQVAAVADAGGVVTEADESNNQSPLLALSVTAAPVDLTIGAVSGPTSGTRGRTITVSGTVRNLGTAAAGVSTAGVYLSRDSVITTADTRLGDVAVPALAAGGSYTFRVTVTVPSTLAAATYTVGAIADRTNAVAESNETNNARAGNTIRIR